MKLANVIHGTPKINTTDGGWCYMTRSARGYSGTSMRWVAAFNACISPVFRWWLMRGVLATVKGEKHETSN